MILMYYTRQPLDEAVYAPRLAYSLHMALWENGGWLPLNHNSGVVFAKAQSNEDGTLHPYSLEKPWLRMEDGRFVLLARRIEADGGEDASSAGKLLRFLSDDLIYFEEQALVSQDSDEGQAYLAHCAQIPGEASLPEGAVPGGVVEISDDAAQRLRNRLITPVNTVNEVPAQVVAASPEEMAAVKAIARYSDGSSVEKRIDWWTDGVKWDQPGQYAVKGVIHQDRFEFPVAWHKADPCVARWNGHYYFISTNDLDGNHTLFIRRADTLAGLATAQQVNILDTTMYPHLGNLLWAPELHTIKGRLYIFHAGTPGPFVQEQSHVMALKEGGNPMVAADWEMPVRVEKANGDTLYDEHGITLDMTVFTAGGKHYAVWAQRQFQPVDQGSWLYIAQLDPDHPWRLMSDPVLLTVPEYGWENNHVFVVEGPYVLKRDGRILLTYSGALVDSTYTVGMMSMAEGDDPLDRASWRKENYPLMSSRSVEGEYGPGHNAYVTDDDGFVWNTYHARPGLNAPRSSGFRRVHFNCEDFPMLDMTEEMDLAPDKAVVETILVIP